MATYRRLLVFIGFLLSLAPIPNPTFAQALSPDYPVPYQSITVQEEATIERTALIALRHISQARAALHRGEKDKARQELDEANRLIDTIRDHLSPAAVKELIQVARRHLEYEKPQKVVRDLASVYAALDRASVYLPTDKAKAHLAAAKKHLEENDKSGGDRELVEADRSLVMVEIEPALATSQQYLKQAQQQFSASADKADELLQSAEQQMTTLYTGMSSLLYQAKQSLGFALRYQNVARESELGQFLARARDYLSRAAGGGNTTGKVEAGKLAQQVSVVELKLRKEGNAASTDLRALWERCSALADRSAQYLAAGLTETDTALWQDNDLIEARLHLSYAQTFQLTTQEAEKAAAELAITHNYLDKAARNTTIAEALRNKISEIDKSLQSLKKDTTKKDSDAIDAYSRARGELDALIQKV